MAVSPGPPNPTPAHPPTAASWQRWRPPMAEQDWLMAGDGSSPPVCLILMAAWTHKVFDAKYNPVFSKQYLLPHGRIGLGHGRPNGFPLPLHCGIH